MLLSSFTCSPCAEDSSTEGNVVGNVEVRWLVIYAQRRAHKSLRLYTASANWHQMRVKTECFLWNWWRFCTSTSEQYKLLGCGHLVQVLAFQWFSDSRPGLSRFLIQRIFPCLVISSVATSIQQSCPMSSHLKFARNSFLPNSMLRPRERLRVTCQRAVVLLQSFWFTSSRHFGKVQNSWV